MSKFPFALIIVLSTLAACADKGATDTEDTVTDSVDSVDSVDSETSDTVSAYVAMFDVSTANYMPNTTVTFDGETTITDADGYVNLELPQNTTLTLLGAAPGFMNSALVLFTLDDLIRTYITMLPTAMRDGLSAQLGIPYDATKGIVTVEVYTYDDAGGPARLAGATVDLDVPYSIALSSDLRSPALVVPSNVTVTEEKSNAQILFINVQAGPAHATVTPPDPTTACVWYRGDTPVSDYTIEVAADTMTNLLVFCE